MANNINQGLEGVVVAATSVAHIDGANGELVYAGYMMEEIIERNCIYEDVFYLLLHGKLPSPTESKHFVKKLASERTLSPEVESVIDALPKNLNYMDAFRTGISILGSEVDTLHTPIEEQAICLVAKAPIVLSRYYRLKTNQLVLKSDPALSHVANYFYLITGNKPDTASHIAYARALDTYFVTTIEHGMNASTFAARVSTSTQSDLFSSITAAISTLKGPLHGGAPSEVIHMIDAIGTKENAEPWMRDVLEKGERLMGFGHRVYKSGDPRAKALKQIVEQLPSDDENYQLELSRHIEQIAIKLLSEYKPGRNLYTNVEFWAASILRAVGLPSEIYPATFGVARCGGWVAHILEQSKHNRLIRPSALYVGAWPQAILERKNKNKIDQPCG